MGAFSQFAQEVDWTALGSMILRVAAILLCLVVHEVCHGLAAYRLGDPTAKRNHRLSMNPIRHLDVFGLIMMVTVGFGWAKPVPVDPRYFRNPKKGMAITALAGPASNFVLAYLSALALNFLYGAMAVRGESTLGQGAGQFFSLLILMNIGLGIFNLIPFPPLDGSKVLAMFLPDRAYVKWMRLEKYGMIILMAVLWLGWLDGFLSAARSWVLNLMLNGSQFAYYQAIQLLS
jgi:Zn-dependent protease